jgi:hypothetical protein
MEWLNVVETIASVPFIQQLTLVSIVIGAMKSHLGRVEKGVDGIRTELHDLKSVFRDQNKRLGNVEGTVEAIKFYVYELQADVKELKKE